MREAFDADGKIVAAADATESTKATCLSCGRPVYLTEAGDAFTHDAPPAKTGARKYVVGEAGPEVFKRMSPFGRTHDLGSDEPPQPPNQQTEA